MHLRSRMRVLPRLAIALSATLFIVACQSTSVPKRPIVLSEVGQTVRAVTFNIRVGVGVDDWGESPYVLRFNRKKIQPIVNALQSLNPDVVALQEVYGAGQAREIANGLGMGYKYVAHQSDWWGVAILSRFPITDCDSRQISSKRTAMACVVGKPGNSIVVSSVHRDRDLDDGRSMRTSTAFANKFPNIIYMGDFNIQPSDSRYAEITRLFSDTAMVDTPSAEDVRQSGTFSFGMGLRIDYIFVRGHEFETVDAGLAAFEHLSASDHRAYYAVLQRK